MNPATKSPIKQRPLHTPGQSLRERADNILLDEVLFWLLMPILLLLVAGFQWAQVILRWPPSPLLFFIAALGFGVVSFFKIKRIRQELRQIGLGFDGELAVGQSLEQLRSQGYTVFHDIAEDGYNIDHVLIGPTGVYAIETKARRKPTDHDAQIVYNGQTILVDGHTPDRDPLIQVQANADRVKALLQEFTGKEVPVRPVVMFPGWYVRKTCRSPKIWVVSEEYLPAWLDHEDESLSAGEIQQYASALATYVRSKG